MRLCRASLTSPVHSGRDDTAVADDRDRSHKFDATLGARVLELRRRAFATSSCGSTGKRIGLGGSGNGLLQNSLFESLRDAVLCVGHLGTPTRPSHNPPLCSQGACRRFQMQARSGQSSMRHEDLPSFLESSDVEVLCQLASDTVIYSTRRERRNCARYITHYEALRCSASIT